MNKEILQEDVEAFARSFELYESLCNKTFLITGATGLIGSVLVKCLVELNRQYQLGIHVLVIVRNIRKAEQLFADEWSEIDFRQLELNEITKDTISCVADYIIHLASPTASRYFVENPVETLQTIFDGTRSVLEYANASQIDKMIFASSLEVYGSSQTDELIDEDYQGYVNPLEIRSSYNMGKRVAECLCQSYSKEYGVPIVMARMTQTFGAGVEYEDNRVFAQFARCIIEKKDIELHTQGDTCRMYCYTTDAVSALLYLLIRGNKGEAYNVANKDSYISIREMAELVKMHFCPEIDVKIVKKDNQGYAPVTKLRLDTRKIETLGWHPHYNLIEMFDRLIAYLR